MHICNFRGSIMNKYNRKTKGFHFIVSIAILWSVFGFVRPVFADLPVVSAQLAHGNWLHLYGDSVDNNELPYTHKWMLNIDATSGEVTGPRSEFHSTRPFVSFDPYPTSYIPPSTYIWDYPDRLLNINKDFSDLHPIDGSVVTSPGFTAVRSVNNPLLLNDVTTQAMDFTLKFEKPLSPNINNINVHLGTWASEQSIVEESTLLQNNVPGWSNNGDGSWNIDPNDIVIGASYNFQVHIRCTKKPQYRGIAIYHKPQAFVQISEQSNLPDVEGPNTVITYPEGETAYFQLNESVRWNRSISLDRQELYLDRVSLPLDDSNPEVNAIELDHGKEYNAAGTYLGHFFGIDIQGKNIVAAEVTTPTGRTWAIDVEEDWIGWDDAEYLTTADLTALGIVEGTYNFAFHGLLGKTITASVNMTFDTPTQSPNITHPSHWDEGVKIPLAVAWKPVQDTSIDTVAVYIESNEDNDYEFDTELPSDQNSCPVPDVPPYDSINCYVAFANTQAGQTPEGIEWSIYNFTQQEIHFTSGTFNGDFDSDGDVDIYDFAVILEAWLNEAGQPNWNPICDISEPKDNIINWSDFAVFAQDWLAGIE